MWGFLDMHHETRIVHCGGNISAMRQGQPQAAAGQKGAWSQGYLCCLTQLRQNGILQWERNHYKE